MRIKRIKIGKNVTLANNKSFTVIAGPCVIESEKHALTLAASLKKITSELKISFIFKASYDKANRSSFSSFRGPGVEEGLKILGRIREQLKVPVITDVHNESQAPRSVKVSLLLPKLSAFLITLVISSGAKNCPFFILIGFPVRAHAFIKSV